jgi:hypothetical protein
MTSPCSAEVPDGQAKADAVMSGSEHNTIHRMDLGYREELDEAIQAEPVNGPGPGLRGNLESIGIEKGTPFEPDFRMKEILTDARRARTRWSIPDRQAVVQEVAKRLGHLGN